MLNALMSSKHLLTRHLERLPKPNLNVPTIVKRTTVLSRSEPLVHLKTAIGLRPKGSDNRLGTSSTDSISVGVRPSPVAATSAGVEARFQPCFAPSSESTAVLRNHSAKGWLPHVPSCSKSKIKTREFPNVSLQFVQLCFMEGADAPYSMNILYELISPHDPCKQAHCSLPIRPVPKLVNSCQAGPPSKSKIKNPKSKITLCLPSPKPS
jgi:hypothetical protein